MDYSQQGAKNAYPPATKMSRIDSDISRVNELAQRVQDATSRVMMHSRSLGYFQDQPEPGATMPHGNLTPVSTTLQDAIAGLDRALDRLSASLNVFD